MADAIDLWLSPSKLQLIVSALDFYAHNQVHDCAAAIQLHDSLNKRLDHEIGQAKIREAEKADWNSLEVEFQPEKQNCPVCEGACKTVIDNRGWLTEFMCINCNGTGKI